MKWLRKKIPAALATVALMAAACAPATKTMRPTEPRSFEEGVVANYLDKKAPPVIARNQKDLEEATAHVLAAHAMQTGQVRFNPATQMGEPMVEMQYTDPRYQDVMFRLLHEADLNKSGSVGTEEARRLHETVTTQMVDLHVAANNFANALAQRKITPIFTTYEEGQRPIHGVILLVPKVQVPIARELLTKFLESHGLKANRPGTSNQDFKIEQLTNTELDDALVRFRKMHLTHPSKKGKPVSEMDALKLASKKVGITVSFSPAVYSHGILHPVHIGLREAAGYSAEKNTETVHGYESSR